DVRMLLVVLGYRGQMVEQRVVVRRRCSGELEKDCDAETAHCCDEESFERHERPPPVVASRGGIALAADADDAGDAESRLHHDERGAVEMPRRSEEQGHGHVEQRPDDEKVEKAMRQRRGMPPPARSGEQKRPWRRPRDDRKEYDDITGVSA